MNTQKLTQKSLEAIQTAQKIGSENHNQELQQEHVLLALVQPSDGLIRQILGQMGTDPAAFERALEEQVARFPKVTGQSELDRVYVSQDLNDALNEAENQAAQMKDEYISVEHLFLGMLKKPSVNVRVLFGTFHITENGFLNILKTVRGNTRVTSDNPEDTYDVLKKYGQDLEELARQQKLDPVTGRDS